MCFAKQTGWISAYFDSLCIFQTPNLKSQHLLHLFIIIFPQPPIHFIKLRDLNMECRRYCILLFKSSPIIRMSTDLSGLCAVSWGSVIASIQRRAPHLFPLSAIRNSSVSNLDSVRPPLMYLLWLIVLPALPLKSTGVWSNHGPLWRKDRAIFGRGNGYSSLCMHISRVAIFPSLFPLWIKVMKSLSLPLILNWQRGVLYKTLSICCEKQWTPACKPLMILTVCFFSFSKCGQATFGYTHTRTLTHSHTHSPAYVVIRKFLFVMHASNSISYGMRITFSAVDWIALAID